MKRLTRQGYFLGMAPPLLVYVLAVLLFQLSATNTVSDLNESIKSLVATHGGTSAKAVLSEAKARYLWFSTVIIDLTVSVYAIVLFCFIIYRVHPWRRLLLVSIVWVGLCGLGIASLLLEVKTNGALYRLVFGMTYLTLQESGRFDATFLGNTHTIISMVNLLAVIAPVTGLLAACSTLAPLQADQCPDPQYFATRMRHLRKIVNAGSWLLAFGILHMAAWLQWPASLVSDKTAHEAILGATLSITIFWGATFTLVLIAIYGPAASYLGAQARKLLEEEDHSEEIPDPQQWLNEHKLSLTLGEQLPQIAAMLAPLIAGPLGAFLMNAPIV